MRWRPVLGEEEAGVIPDTGAVVQGEEEGTRWEDRRKRPEVETRCFQKIVFQPLLALLTQEYPFLCCPHLARATIQDRLNPGLCTFSVVRVSVRRSE